APWRTAVMVTTWYAGPVPCTWSRYHSSLASEPSATRAMKPSGPRNISSNSSSQRPMTEWVSWRKSMAGIIGSRGPECQPPTIWRARPGAGMRWSGAHGGADTRQCRWPVVLRIGEHELGEGVPAVQLAHDGLPLPVEPDDGVLVVLPEPIIPSIKISR